MVALAILTSAIALFGFGVSYRWKTGRAGGWRQVAKAIAALIACVGAVSIVNSALVPALGMAIVPRGSHVAQDIVIGVVPALGLFVAAGAIWLLGEGLEWLTQVAAERVHRRFTPPAPQALLWWQKRKTWEMAFLLALLAYAIALAIFL